MTSWLGSPHEGRLYRYPRDAARLELLRLQLGELSSLSGQRYDVLGGGSGDPVAERAIKVIDLEHKIAALEARCRPVEALLSYLDGGGAGLRGLGEIVRRRYFRREGWKEIQWGMRLSERTLYRRKQEILNTLENWAW